MRFAVVNLGCKVNRVESDAFAAALLSQGARAADAHEAELVIVNTCTVTGEAEKKARKAVRRALRENPRAAVAVTGCAAALDAAGFEALDPRVRVYGKAQLADAIARGEFADGGPAAGGGSANAGASAPSACAPAASAPLPVGAGFRTRVGVKVQDGCDNACTYCIVHVARGRSTSRPANEVVAECAALARAGVKEIVLTGINLGAWRGAAAGGGGHMRLAGLLRAVLDATADLHEPGQPPARLRISSIEPRDVDDDLIGLLAEADGRVCRHLHLPLQAGSDTVLREMARPYTPERFAGLVDGLRAAVPQISLSTDLIVGFPGETRAEFAETMALAGYCRFSRLHVFPYSRREGTPAAARPDQVPPEEKAARARELRELGARLRAQDYARRAGTRELVLVEDDGRATTESYHEVRAPEGAAPGELLEMALPPVAQAGVGKKTI